jgi:hypothetical protein
MRTHAEYGVSVLSSIAALEAELYDMGGPAGSRTPAPSPLADVSNQIESSSRLDPAFSLKANPRFHVNIFDTTDTCLGSTEDWPSLTLTRPVSQLPTEMREQSASHDVAVLSSYGISRFSTQEYSIPRETVQITPGPVLTAPLLPSSLPALQEWSAGFDTDIWVLQPQRTPAQKHTTACIMLLGAGEGTASRREGGTAGLVERVVRHGLVSQGSILALSLHASVVQSRPAPPSKRARRHTTGIPEVPETVITITDYDLFAGADEPPRPGRINLTPVSSPGQATSLIATLLDALHPGLDGCSMDCPSVTVALSFQLLDGSSGQMGPCLRLMLPDLLLPSTAALTSICATIGSIRATGALPKEAQVCLLSDPTVAFSCLPRDSPLLSCLHHALAFVRLDDLASRTFTSTVLTFMDGVCKDTIKLHMSSSAARCVFTSCESAGGKMGFGRHVIASIRAGKRVPNYVTLESCLGWLDQLASGPQDAEEVGTGEDGRGEGRREEIMLPVTHTAMQPQVPRSGGSPLPSESTFTTDDSAATPDRIVEQKTTEEGSIFQPLVRPIQSQPQPMLPTPMAPSTAFQRAIEHAAQLRSGGPKPNPITSALLSSPLLSSARVSTAATVPPSTVTRGPLQALSTSHRGTLAQLLQSPALHNPAGNTVTFRANQQATSGPTGTPSPIKANGGVSNNVPSLGGFNAALSRASTSPPFSSPLLSSTITAPTPQLYVPPPQPHDRRELHSGQHVPSHPLSRVSEETEGEERGEDRAHVWNDKSMEITNVTSVLSTTSTTTPVQSPMSRLANRIFADLTPSTVEVSLVSPGNSSTFVLSPDATQVDVATSFHPTEAVSVDLEASFRRAFETEAAEQKRLRERNATLEATVLDLVRLSAAIVVEQAEQGESAQSGSDADAKEKGKERRGEKAVIPSNLPSRPASKTTSCVDSSSSTAGSDEEHTSSAASGIHASTAASLDETIAHAREYANKVRSSFNLQATPSTSRSSSADRVRIGSSIPVFKSRFIKATSAASSRRPSVNQPRTTTEPAVGHDSKPTTKVTVDASKGTKRGGGRGRSSEVSSHRLSSSLTPTTRSTPVVIVERGLRLLKSQLRGHQLESAAQAEAVASGRKAAALEPILRHTAVRNMKAAAVMTDKVAILSHELVATRQALEAEHERAEAAEAVLFDKMTHLANLKAHDAARR